MPAGVNLGSAYGRIVIQDSATSVLTSVKSGLLGLSSPFGLAKAGAIAFGAGLGAITVAAGGLTAAIGSSVKVASDLESQLSGVQSVMGNTDDQMAQLKSLITDLGVDPKLKVSSLEAAQAIEMLGRNGLDTQEILDGAARSTVLLSNATGGDFAQSADIATDVMALFNIEAGDMMTAVDGITGVVNNSKFSINDYALALAQGGGVAATAGVSFDEFNTVIAGIAPLFASGSDAGTSFKTFLQRLVPQSKDAKKAMEELGLEFFDTNGNMKDMGEIAGMLQEKLFKEFQMTVELGGATDDMVKAAEKANQKIPGLTTKIAEQESQMSILKRELEGVIEKYGESSIQADKKRLAITKLSNDLDENRAKLQQHQDALGKMADATVQTITTTTKLTEEQRNNTLATIFGTDAMRTAAGMAALGTDGYNDLAAAIHKTSAADAAAKRMDNLAGSMEILDGIIETIKIRIGDEFIPSIRRGVEALSTFLEANSDKIVGFFSGIANFIEGRLDRINELITAFQSGGLFGSRSGSFGSSGLLAAMGLDQNTVGQIENVFNNIKEAWDNLMSGDIFAAAKPLVPLMAGLGGNALLSALGLDDDLVTQAEAILDNLSAAYDRWMSGGGLFRSTIGGTELEAAGILDALGIPPDIQDTLENVITGIQDLFSQIDQIIQSYKTGGTEGVLQQLFGVSTFQELAGKILSEIPTVLSDIVTGITDFLTNQAPKIQETVQGWSMQFWSWVDTAITQAGTALEGLLVAIVAWAMSPEAQTQLSEMGNSLGQLLVTGIKNLFEKEEAIAGILLKIAGGLAVGAAAIAGILIAAGGQIAAGILAGILEAITGEEWQPALVSDLGNMLKGIGDQIVTIAKLLGTNIVGGITQGIKDESHIIKEGILEGLGDAFNAAKDFLGIHSPSDLFAKGIGLPGGQGIALGFRQAQPEIKQAVTDSIPTPDEVRAATASTPAAALAAPTSTTNQTGPFGDIIIQIDGAGNPADVATEVRRQLQGLFNLAQAGALAG